MPLTIIWELVVVIYSLNFATLKLSTFFQFLMKKWQSRRSAWHIKKGFGSRWKFYPNVSATRRNWMNFAITEGDFSLFQLKKILIRGFSLFFFLLFFFYLFDLLLLLLKNICSKDSNRKFYESFVVSVYAIQTKRCNFCQISMFSFRSSVSPNSCKLNNIYFLHSLKHCTGFLVLYWSCLTYF